MSTEAQEQEVQNEIVEEVVETVEEEVVAPDDDAAFESGFAQATGAEVPEPKAEPEPEPEIPTVFGFTEQQVKEMYAKAQEVDRLKESQAKIFGTLGSMKQAIERREQQPQATAKITKDMFKRLSAEFPEMAEMLSEDLGQIQLGGQSAFDPKVVEDLVTQRVQKVSRETEAKLLTVMHPDWQKVPQDPLFTEWMGHQTPEVQQTMMHEWDAIKVGGCISAFKEWKSKTAQSKVSKQSRLESALQPRTTARTAPVMTDDDAFMEGFKQARGR